jgi:WD40 repeat protein/serine/threonine protein kinase
MNPSDSLQLDEHLARLLAAYDQGIGEADGKAPTLDLKPTDGRLVPGNGAGGSLPSGPANEGSMGDLLPDGPPRTPPPLPQGPHRVGRFELRRQLGKGGCGIVFLAYDPRLQREVALKIPRPEMLMSPDARRRLIREAQAAAEFDHPNLVPVYETGEIGPVCFIATAFCPGQTLAEWLDRQSFPVSVRQAARLVATLAEAVQHAHDRGVLHRDLKPNNVILQVIKADPNTSEGPPPGACPLRGDHVVPRVVDFGLAKLADRGTGDTATRHVLGTPKYMAPEQAQGRRDDVGPAADVYALGVILYELLAGRTPFDGATDVEVLRQAIDGHLTPPRSLRTEIPRDLEAICLKAMDRVPGKRYRTAIDLAEDLRRFLEGLPTLARPLNFVGRANRWLRRNDQWVALGVVSTLALVFLVIGAWNVYQTDKLKAEQKEAEQKQAEQMQVERRREYTRHVRDAFLSWRSGDAQQMAASLDYARRSAEMAGDEPEFAWGYLSQLGRVERQSVPCPAGAAVALAVSLDGRRVATGHPDGTLAVWDRDTATLVGSVKAHPDELTHVAFLASGGLVTAGGEPVVRTWAVGRDGTLRPAAVSPALAVPVSCLAVAPDGRAVYVGSAGGECLCWDAVGNRVVRQWPATAGAPVDALAVSPDGTVLATAGRAEPVRLWDTATGAPAGEVRAAGGAAILTTVPDPVRGWLLVAADRADGTVRLFDRQGREVRTLPGQAGPILAIAASPDGSALASGGQDYSVCVWEVSTGSIRSLLRGHDKSVRGVRFGPDGKTLFTASEDGLLKVWDLTADPEGQAVRGLPAAVGAVGFHPEGREFAVAFADGSVEVYPDRGATPRRFPADGHGPVTVLRYRDGGPAVGVELAGKWVYCWGFAGARRQLFQADLPDGAVATAADLSAGGTRLAVGDDRGRVTVWALDGGSPAVSFTTGLDTPVRMLSISDDGTRVAAQAAGQVVGVWDLAETQKPGRTVPGYGDGLWLIRFLPGGARLVTTGRGGSIRVWRLYPTREEWSLFGHVGRVTGVTASPDGRTLVSSSSTGEVKLWDLQTGQEMIGLRRHTGPVTVAEFAPGGKLLLTGGMTAGGRGELAFWDAAGKE